MNSAAGFFLVFCALLASRDAITHRLLSDMNQPIAVLAIYCTLACVYAWLFKWYRTGSSSVLAEYRKLTRNQKLVFLKLGVCTVAVYAFTVFGISLVGATMFNFVDYGMMPLMTIVAAMLISGESLDRPVLMGSSVALVGIVIFFLYSSAVSWQLNVGLIFACLSPVFTSISSAYQKQQVDSGLSPDLVLMFRFPIPAAAMIVAAIVFRPTIDTKDLPILIGTSFFGVFLPLLLLCYGFARSSLSKFSAYLFLIPIMTFVLGPVLVESEWSKLTDPFVITGMIIVLLGFFIAEGTLKSLLARKSPAPSTKIEPN